VQSISAFELNKLFQSNQADKACKHQHTGARLVLVDVRTSEEYQVRLSLRAKDGSIIPKTFASMLPPLQVSMIPSACTVTCEEFDARREHFRDEGYTVVTYCTAGLRSFSFADALIKKHGFPASKVYNLEGSIIAWTQEGLPLVQRKERLGGDVQLVETTKVHVYSKSWALQRHGYQPVFLRVAPRSLSPYISALTSRIMALLSIIPVIGLLVWALPQVEPNGVFRHK